MSNDAFPTSKFVLTTSKTLNPLSESIVGCFHLLKVLAEEQAENRIFEHEVPPTKIGNESSNNNGRNSRNNNNIYEETDEEIETRFRQQYENMGKTNNNKPKDFLSGYSRNRARVNPVQGDVPRAKAGRLINCRLAVKL